MVTLEKPSAGAAKERRIKMGKKRNWVPGGSCGLGAAFVKHGIKLSFFSE